MEPVERVLLAGEAAALVGLPLDGGRLRSLLPLLVLVGVLPRELGLGALDLRWGFFLTKAS